MIPKELSRIDAELEHDQEELKKASEDGKSTELEIKQVESNIAALNDEIEKLQQQSSMVRKNDEYRAMMNEIAGVKKKIGDLETRELELMDCIDEFKNGWRDKEKSTADRAESLKNEKNELVELEADIKKEIDALDKQRAPLLEPIDDSILSLYTKLLNRGAGKPMVKVHHGSCGNCHLRLTPQTVNLARKADKVSCENCGHILYAEEGEDPGAGD
jgi:predicted  nucleic acid-binding Zn-ribbon protein